MVPGQLGSAVTVGDSLKSAPDPVQTYAVCGVSIAALSTEDARDYILRRSLRGGGLAVHLCNAYTLSLVGTDDRLRGALLASDLNLPDGAPVAWLGRRVGATGPVRGPSLMSEVIGAGLSFGLRHYLYGGRPGVVDRLRERLQERFPGVLVCGAEQPPFHDLTEIELEELASRLHDSRAHIVWIAIGTPRQDHLVERLSAVVECAVVPVGAAFDYLSGEVAEAPRLLHGSGAEWIFRLAREPRRLAKRYLFGNPRFLVALFRTRNERRQS